GLPSPEARRPPDAGYNPPFGATVFFHVPENYDGQTPATLQFTDPQGNLVRLVTFHLATEKEKEDKAKEEQEGGVHAGQHLENAAEADHSAEPSDQRIREKEAKLGAIEPGMNRLQWDLRYPYATEVTGYHAPIAAGGLEDSVEGPVVVPGKYSVVLNYGGQETRQSFVVALDPRLHATQQDLQARLNLDLKIHADLESLDKAVNEALVERDNLQKAISSHSVSGKQATRALTALSHDIDSVAQMAMKSSEGSLLFETKLRDHLAYLASDIDMAYDRPSASQEAVFRELDQLARQGTQKLVADTGAAARIAARTASEEKPGSGRGM
ncbi:MAG: hypothetical protein WA197_02120, partial [Candidatus Acidiferrales bacterium]